jgi:hypothetical protein
MKDKKINGIILTLMRVASFVVGKLFGAIAINPKSCPEKVAYATDRHHIEE